MKTEIFSREKIEALIAKNGGQDFPKNTAVISFRDRPMMPNDPYCKPIKYPNGVPVFHCVADDISHGDFEASHPRTRNVSIDKFFIDAIQMADYILEQAAKGTETIICQCEHGQSRSAGAAAAIEEFYNAEGISIFADYRYSPNKIIFNKLITALVMKDILRRNF